ncbi:Xaa-Pro peptidase family protein [Kordiimonas sp. SCSIO 12610]|uniref:M24 family metallopeptidase n=1 Tax=Kordiimonas sp. SCSIO 12610 TaxID=2829597 RepID=UPI00210987FD|nr:Xaa-Pro peptidase family protein [Kordiimonas sp. SCSIO 12610]UTW55249.1 aminopeptidase P family protein [Kordiimonas sp. SCSIO 12610]
MSISKRNFLKLTGAAGAIGAAGASLAASPLTRNATSVQKSKLEDITGSVSPITVQERVDRVRKAQTLMAEKGIDAIVLEPGSAMLYFTGIRWRRSERLTAIVIPREGDLAVVTPFFEEPSVRESMTFGDDVRTWHEHESPFERVVGILKDRGIKAGKIGFEDTVRYFVVEGLKTASSDYEIVSALPITLGCRMFKSEHELQLMKKANEVTLGAYAHVYSQLDKGMTPADVRALMGASQRALGGQNAWALILMGEASAYPHGTSQPQTVEEGQIVLMDCGCSVHGYQSDISRTFVFGEPNKRQREVWNTVKRGQEIAFEAAQLGTPAGQVDDAVRRYYESLGYGPGYKTPGLSHRTGHGIGMDGHESVNFVHGEETKLAPGMCFSNEPGIYIFGEFGVRFEDCIYMTKEGPAWFTTPPESLENPIGALG